MGYQAARPPGDLEAVPGPIMSQQPKVLLVHPGTQHAPRLAEQLEKQNLLFRFWTGWSRSENSFGKRSVAIPRDKLRTRKWIEWVALLMNRAGIHSEKVWFWRNAIFQKLVSGSEIEAADVVVGFDTASWILARRAKACGKTFVLEQSTGHPAARSLELNKIGLGSEAWPKPFEPRLQKLVEIEKKEHEMADSVVVASTFAKRTLVEQGVEEGKIRILPYGVGENFFEAGGKRRTNEQRVGPVRFLFLGHLSAGKGLKQLLLAWSGFDQRKGELVLMGAGEQGVWRGLAGVRVIFRGPGSRQAVLAEMMRCDVLVFPSLFEGFGLVILEAMAAGMAVIVSQNTGGPDVITEGKEGFILPAGDVKALRKKMEYCIQNPEKVVEMGHAASEKAKSFTWEEYGKRYKSIIFQTLRNHHQNS